MACFIVPGTEAIVTTAITKIVEKKEKKEICSCETEGAVEAVKEEKVLPFSRKLRWLNNMLWGGTALLAFEHVWHGEVTPFFPFLTAAGNAQDAVQMLKEMATARCWHGSGCYSCVGRHGSNSFRSRKESS